jgi:AraC-like DNA-binding protein
VKVNQNLVPVSELIPQYLSRIGLDYAEVLRRSGIIGSNGAQLHVTASQYCAMWRALEEMGVPRDLGFDIVVAPQVHQYDVASIAALHAPTLREALSTLARYKRLSCPEIIDVSETDQEATIHVSWLGVNGGVPPMLIDCAFSWLLKLGSQGLGEVFRPLRVELARREEHLELLRRGFRCEVYFNAARDALILPSALLDRPFVTRNADLLETMAPGLEASLRKRLAPESLGDRVKAVILKKMQGKRPAIDDLARDFGMSARTLQRHLRDAGISYQHLLDEVRRETATRLLSSTDLDPEVVGFILGFQELNSFTRAFRNWEGMTPSRWRKDRRAAPLSGKEG